MERTKKQSEFEDTISNAWKWGDVAKDRVGVLPDGSYSNDFDGASVALEGSRKAIDRANQLLIELQGERDASNS